MSNSHVQTAGATVQWKDVPVSQKEVTASPQFDQLSIPLPTTGPMHNFHIRSANAVLAPLKITTDSTGPNYYVKVVSLQAGPAFVLFIRSGELASVKLPLGTYELRYAAGENWYGEEYLFGPDTIYRRVDAQLKFEIEGDKVAGYTVELIKQANGNLQETQISPNDF